MKLYVDNKLISGEIKVADNFKTKLIGLLNKKILNENEGLFLKNCSSIHCFFMKFTIDALYLSSDLKVLYKETINPWQVGKLVKNCSHILELPKGRAEEITVGDYIFLEE